MAFKGFLTSLVGPKLREKRLEFRLGFDRVLRYGSRGGIDLKKLKSKADIWKKNDTAFYIQADFGTVMFMAKKKEACDLWVRMLQRCVEDKDADVTRIVLDIQYPKHNQIQREAPRHENIDFHRMGREPVFTILSEDEVSVHKKPFKFSEAYQVGELLGRGAFGWVVSARESGGGKAKPYDLAVKVFRKTDSQAARGSDLVTRLNVPWMFANVSDSVPRTAMAIDLHNEKCRKMANDVRKEWRLLLEFHRLRTEDGKGKGKGMKGGKDIGKGQSKGQGQDSAESQLLLPQADDLGHKHVLEAVAAHEDADFVYLVTPRYAHSLRSIAKKVRGNPRDVRHLVLGVVKGLHWMHQHGYAHWDLKLDNVMVTDDGRPVLIDIGFSVPMRPREHKAAGHGYVGTQGWSAPEMNDRNRPVGLKNDIWAIGVLLYRLRATPPKEDKDKFAKPFPEFGTEKDGLLKGSEQAKELATWHETEQELVLACLNAHKPEERPSTGQLLDFDYFKADLGGKSVFEDKEALGKLMATKAGAHERTLYVGGSLSDYSSASDVSSEEHGRRRRRRRSRRHRGRHGRYGRRRRAHRRRAPSPEHAIREHVSRSAPYVVPRGMVPREHPVFQEHRALLAERAHLTHRFARLQRVVDRCLAVADDC